MPTPTQRPVAEAGAVVGNGPNRGVLRDNTDFIISRTTIVRDACIVLKRRGFNALYPELFCQHSPVIWIETSARCTELKGYPVQWGHDEAGPYQRMEARFGGCRLAWKVRGH